MDEELAGKFRQLEARAHIAAVEHDGAFGIARLLDPGRQRLALGIEQPAPEPDLARAVTRPVICRDEAGMMAAGIPEEDEVRGEVERREIARLVRLHVGGQAQRFEAEDLRIRRQEMADLAQLALRLEACDEDSLAFRLRERRHRLRLASAER